MDPELEKRVAAARANGYSDAEISAKLKSAGIDWSPTPAGPPPNTSANPLSTAGALNLGRSAVQGASFDFADEIVGKLPKWLGGGKEAEERWRAKDKAFKGDHPIIAGGAALAGGLAVPGLGAYKTLGTGVKTIRGAIGAGAALGGAAGALSGAGAAEGDIGDRAKAAVLPGALGAVAGGVIPGGAAILKSLSPAVRASTRMNVAIGRSGGVSKLLDKLKEFKEAGRGKDVMLADLSTPLQQTTDFAANASEDAADKIGQIAYGRHEDASNRILEDVRGVVGDPRADKITKDLGNETAAWARGPDGFQGLRDANPKIANPAAAKEFREFLGGKPPKGPDETKLREMTADNPIAALFAKEVKGAGGPAVSAPLHKAWVDARKIGLIGPMPKAKELSFEVLQQTKEMLDDAVDAAYRSGRGGLGERLGAGRDELVAKMETHIEGYSEKLSQYHVRKDLERMVETGQEAFKTKDTRGLAEQVSGLKADQLTKFREGMASEMISNLRSTATNRDIAKSLVNSSPATKDKLKIVFGSTEAAEEFMKKMRIEREMSKILTTLTGSGTAKRLAAQKGVDPVDLVLDIATIPVAPWSGASKVAGAFRSATGGKISGSTAKRLAPTLTTHGANAIEELLKKWHTNPRLLGGGMGGMLPVGIGRGAGLLTGD